MPGPPRTEVRPVPAAASAAPSRTQSSSESWGTPIAVAARRDTAPVEVAQAAQGGAVPGRYIQGVSTLYLRGHGGLGFLAEADTSGPGNTANVDFDLGYVLGGALGVEMENGIRIEGEIGYAANDVDSVTGAAAGIAFNSGNVNGSVSSLAMMGNLAYDLDLGGGIKPFVLGGIGLVRISVNDVSIAGTPVADDSDWVFGYQFGGGLKYDLTHQVGVEASYRYLETLDPEFVDSRGIPFEGEYQNHQFLIGAYYKF
jgi:opacity protein-like surface antigen